ncbi:plasma membrane-associated cation-binding protein 1 [Lolium perenne]|uniref:plasma membrane-associated cation-binding protein 1 n=1 Tax=Lolium perenne TaxID=4522 RepID=UPI0021EA5440|nr:plasma membrane-associated cation-binding protein 1-like [Lolium perenne]
MDYWKSKVLPKMKTVFAKSAGKKAAVAAEIVKSFDESKDGINGEFEEKKADLQPKVVEIYESTTAAVKVLIKEKKVSWIKKNSAGVTKFIEDLANIDFPGAKQVSEGIAKVGPALLSSPLFATFDKVASLLPGAEETHREALAVVEKEAAAPEERKEASEEKEGVAEDTKEAVETQVAVAEESISVAAEPATKESAVPAADAVAEAAAPSELQEPAKAQEETPKA